MCIVAEPSADLGRALRLLDSELEPAPRKSVAAALAALKTIVIPRPMADNDHALMARLYVERLAVYPKDVVDAVCLQHRWKFWPALAELEAAADALVARRRLARLKLARNEVTRTGPGHERKRVTAERANAILREVYADSGANEPSDSRSVGRAAEELARKVASPAIERI